MAPSLKERDVLVRVAATPGTSLPRMTEMAAQAVHAALHNASIDADRVDYLAAATTVWMPTSPLNVVDHLERSRRDPDHRVDWSITPNFSLAQCVARVTEEQKRTLDLSRWTLAFNGAEAVNPDTLARFAERYARYGLNPAALTPVYGLAEASVGLLFPPLGRGTLVDSVERETFQSTGRAECSRSLATTLKLGKPGRPRSA